MRAKRLCFGSVQSATISSRSTNTPQPPSNWRRPSSVARALAEGASAVERVDRLIQAVGRQIGITHPAIDRIVNLVDAGIAGNRARAA